MLKNSTGDSSNICDYMTNFWGPKSKRSWTALDPNLRRWIGSIGFACASLRTRDVGCRLSLTGKLRSSVGVGISISAKTEGSPQRAAGEATNTLTVCWLKHPSCGHTDRVTVYIPVLRYPPYHACYPSQWSVFRSDACSRLSRGSRMFVIPANGQPPGLTLVVDRPEGSPTWLPIA